MTCSPPRIVDPFTVLPKDLQAGDVMVCTIALHVLPDWNGDTRHLVYRLYRSPWPSQQLDDYGVPQGTRMGNEKAIMQGCFPVAGYAGAEPDLI